MKHNDLYKNYVYNLLFQVVQLIAPLILVPYISRVLGADAIGKYSYTQSISAYFVLVGSIGISLYGKREIAYVQDDIKKRSRILYEILILRIFMIAMCLFVYYITCIKEGSYSVLFSILSIDIIAVAFDISWYFQGMEKFKQVAVRNIIVKLLSICAILFLVKKPSDLPIYVVCLTLSNLLGNFSLWVHLRQNIVKVPLHSLHIFHHWKPALILFIPQIATQIYTVLDKTMLGYMGQSMIEVGYYDQTQKVLKLLLSIVTSLGVVMLPHVAVFYAKDLHEKIKSNIMNSFRFTFFLASPLMFGIAGIAQNFVPWFYGDNYETIVPLLYIGCPIIFVIGISNVLGVQYMLPTGKNKEYTTSVIGGSIANCFLNFLLIPKFCAFGSMLATLFSELIVTCIQLYYVKDMFHIYKILRQSKNYVISALIMFIIIFISNQFTNPCTFHILLQVVFGMVIYFTTLLIMKDEFLLMLIKKVIKGEK